MPVIILLDNSLSMYKNIDKLDSINKKDLAHLIIQKLVEQITKNDKYENISLIAFSSSAQLLVNFTRDHKKLLESLNTLQAGDSSCIEEALNKANDVVIEEWGCYTNAQIVLITDQVDSLGQYSTKAFYQKLNENKSTLKELYSSMGMDTDSDFAMNNSILNQDFMTSNPNFEMRKKFSSCKYPFSFPNKFDIICLNDDLELNSDKSQVLFGFDDDNFKFQIKTINLVSNSKIFYLTEILKLNSSLGKLYLPKRLDKSYIQNEFMPNFLNESFSYPEFDLKCGNLTSIVHLIPPPLVKKDNFMYSYVNKEISKTFEMIGFVNIPDLTTPRTISRHLLVSKESSDLSDKENQSMEGDSTAKDSFLVLLHTSLKSENMAAIIQIADDWYGAIHCGSETKADGKKKSYLMMAIFAPESGTIESIVFKAAHSVAVKAQSSLTIVAQPQYVRQIPTKSYAKGCIVWYRAYNLVSDVQKILRNAKKMQEKMPIFFKELNRVRRAALTFGFYELFDGLSRMLERELIHFANSYNQDATLQIKHVLNCLSSIEYKDFRKDIQPLVIQASYNKTLKK